MPIDKETIDTLRSAGISFAASVAVPGGGTNIIVQPDRLAEFVRDQRGYAAKLYGVDKAIYEEWVESDGTVQCSGTTASGKRCKNFVSGHTQQEIESWLKMRGQYCAVHGGEGSSHK